MDLKHNFLLLLICFCNLVNAARKESLNLGGLEAVEDMIQNKTKANHRVKRFLGLFNVVQFANTACNTTEANKQGICYTNNECTDMRGRPSGTCAMGFGVCCIFEFSCASTKSDGQEIFFFKNPKFPEGEDTPSICLFGITVATSSICQIRLDFLDFELDGGSAVDQPCNRESLEIFGGDGASNLGMGKLCGRNTGQHVYIPIRSQQSAPMLRISTDGRSTSTSANFTTAKYKWNIKITQIDCTSKSMQALQMLAPSGCLQYFLERTGTVSSFNWNPVVQRQYNKNQNYAICFRRTENDCKVELRRSTSAPAYSTSVGSFYGTNTATTFPPTRCGPDNGCGSMDCLFLDTTTINANLRADYLQVINGRYYKNPQQTTIATPQKFVVNALYCGAGLGRDSSGQQATIADGQDDRTGVIVQGPGPFVVVFHTDDFSSLSNIQVGQANSIAQNELGFSIDFKVATSCTPLPLDKEG